MTCRYGIFPQAAFANGASWSLTQAPVQAELYEQIVRDCGDGAIGPTDIACRIPGLLIVDQRLIWAFVRAHRYLPTRQSLPGLPGLADHLKFKVVPCVLIVQGKVWK